MDNSTFMGLLIGALVVLLGLAGTIVGLIIKPILNLNQNITKLNASVDSLNKSVGVIENRISKHGQEIDDIKDDLRKTDSRISKIEGGKGK